MDDGYTVCVCECVCVCVSDHSLVDFVGYQSEEWDPPNPSLPLPVFFFSVIICAP